MITTLQTQFLSTAAKERKTDDVKNFITRPDIKVTPQEKEEVMYWYILHADPEMVEYMLAIGTNVTDKIWTSYIHASDIEIANMFALQHRGKIPVPLDAVKKISQRFNDYRKISECLKRYTQHRVKSERKDYENPLERRALEYGYISESVRYENVAKL